MRIEQQRAIRGQARGHQAHLKGGGEIRADQRDLAPGESRVERERIERVVFGATVAHRGQRFGHQSRAGQLVEREAVDAAHAERLNVSGTPLIAEQWDAGRGPLR